MKRFLVLFISISLFSCKTVEDWSVTYPLDLETKQYAEQFLSVYDATKVVEPVSLYNSEGELLTDEELKEIRQKESENIQYTGQLNHAWFEFNLQLRLDPGYLVAYKSHYYFKKAIDALEYSDKKRDVLQSRSLKDEESYLRLLELEILLRVSIAEIVSFNSSIHDTELLFKELKSLYRSIN